MVKHIKVSQNIINKMADIINRYTNYHTDIAIATLKYILSTVDCYTILTSKIKPVIAAVMPKYHKNNRLCCLIMDEVITDRKIAKLLNKKQKEIILKIKEDILKELNIELSIETL